MKQFVSLFLKPIAFFVHRFGESARRIWAHARFAAAIKGSLDSSVVVLGVPEIRGTGNLKVGSNLFLYRELYLETQEEGEIAIGDDVVMSRGVHIVSFNRIEIGDGTMIGEYTSIRDANHRFGGGVAIRTSGHDSKPIRIGKNVWIGRCSTILPGITIGDEAVVGANAVVTKDVAPGALVAGVPAKPIERKGP
ncbi:MAG: acyltransferase [Acidobacteriota bacterium]|nr:MAG: acyltransferase [Acidobacteriota bacterium]